MKTFDFLICPNAIPCANLQEFVRAVSKTPIKTISIREEWQAVEEVYGSHLNIGAICLCENFAQREMQDKLIEVTKRAASLGLSIVNVATPHNISLADQKSTIDFFRDVATLAEDNSLCLTLETYGAISRTAVEALNVFERVNNPAFKICYDTANVWRFAPEFKSAEDLTDDFRKLKGIIGYMHLKDYDPQIKKIMALGRGKIDFPAIFTLLSEWEYDGFIGLDLETAYATKQNTLEAHESELQVSIDYLSKLKRLKL